MTAPSKRPDQGQSARQVLGVNRLEIALIAFLVVSAGALAWIAVDGGLQQVLDVQAGKTGGLVTGITRPGRG